MIPQFANPLMLWGVAAAAVPVIIHLLNRRRYRVQRWAAMEWLLAAARKNQKRLRMENLLLLLLRTFAVIFLALALARPTFSDTRLSLDKQASHLFLLLDNSASMGARSGTETAFDRAAGDATALLDDVGAEDPVTLVLTNDDSPAEGASEKSGRARVVIRGTHNHANVRQFIGDLKPVAARADLVEALKALEEAVPAHGSVVPKVAILTDLQRTSFDAGDSRGGESPDAALHATLQRLKLKGAEVVVMDKGRAVSNVAITALRAQDDRDIVQGAAAVFQAEVRNFGDHGVTAEVRFLVDGKERGDVSQTVSLAARPAGGQAPPAGTAQYVVRFDEHDVGPHVLEARIAPDALAVDDVRTFAFEVRRAVRVLAVDGDPNPQAAGASPETFWLKPALAIKEGGPITVQVVDEASYAAETDFSKWDLVVLANVREPAADDAVRRRLEEFVKNGGALLLTVGDNVDPGTWNRELYRDTSPLLPARLDEPRVDPSKAAIFRLDLSESKHPILADITNAANAVYFGAPMLWGRMTLKDVAREKGARVVMTYTDFAKSPALVERTFGKGRVLLLTTTIDDAWGKLPGATVYLPLLHEVVYYMTSHGNAERNLLTYQTYVRSLPDNFAGVEVTGPDGSPVRCSPERPVDAAPYAPVDKTNRPGPYRVTVSLKPADILSPPPPPLTDAFAVALTPVESDLDRLRPEEMESRWPGLVRVSTNFAAAAEAVRPKGGESHAPLIMAAILCLLGEVVLVRKIAKTRAAAA